MPLNCKSQIGNCKSQMLLPLHHRQPHRERTPFPLAFGRSRDRAPVQLDEPLRQREADAGPRVAFRQGRIQLTEHLEESRKILAPDPNPGVGYGDFYEIADWRFLICDLRLRRGHLRFGICN